MDTVNLFLMDMASADNTSGVDRYIGSLLRGLESHPAVHVYWIHLVHDNTRLFCREEHCGYYQKITVPLPQQFKEIIAERFWMRKYNELIFRLVGRLFENKSGIILHLHTLNLIDMALYIREQVPCKIITHLHCIPWKGYYNGNIRKFNDLYRRIYVNREADIRQEDLTTNNCELQSYTDSDHVICVTRCGMEFLKDTMKVTTPISVIPNGMNDYNDGVATDRDTGTAVFRLLYVGVLSESKGLKYILKAMRIAVQKGYSISLTIVGTASAALAKRIECENKDLHLKLLGRIPFEELKEYYRESDAGVIASIQEQSSYVAVEMVMFGLPVITTAVDGLDEMFTHGVNALKVNTHFSKVFGLSVDVDKMAERIIALIENKELRRILGRNARALYQKDFTLERMMTQTVDVYQKVQKYE